MTPKNGTKPLIPYMRQSRQKERTISITDQRAGIQAWAKSNGIKLAKEIVEQGVSGSKNWKERGLGEAIAACERGEAQGIIVAWQDRLSREHGLATAEVWAALETAGARLVAANEGLDTATGDHEMLFSIKAAIAREGWKRARGYWEAGRRNAIDRGVHIGPIPAGYTQGDDGVLLLNGHSDTIRQAFELRAGGASWSKVARHLSQAGVKTSKGSTVWSLKAASKLIENEVYLGIARSGDFRNENAHEPLVTKAIFRAANDRKESRSVVRGDKVPSLLAGMMRCATCGNRLTRDYVKRPSGTYVFYRCRNQGACPARAGVSGMQAEEFVTQAALAHAGTVWGTEKLGDEGAYAEAQQALAEAESELAAFEEMVGVKLPPESKQALAVAEARERLEAVAEGGQIATWYLPAPGGVVATGETGDFTAEEVGQATTRTVFDRMPIDKQREALATLIAGMTVEPGKGKIEERLSIDWKV